MYWQNNNQFVVDRKLKGKIVSNTEVYHNIIYGVINGDNTLLDRAYKTVEEFTKKHKDYGVMDNIRYLTTKDSNAVAIEKAENYRFSTQKNRGTLQEAIACNLLSVTKHLFMALGIFNLNDNNYKDIVKIDIKLKSIVIPTLERYLNKYKPRSIPKEAKLIDSGLVKYVYKSQKGDAVYKWYINMLIEDLDSIITEPIISLNIKSRHLPMTNDYDGSRVYKTEFINGHSLSELLILATLKEDDMEHLTKGLASILGLLIDNNLPLADLSLLNLMHCNNEGVMKLIDFDTVEKDIKHVEVASYLRRELYDNTGLTKVYDDFIHGVDKLMSTSIYKDSWLADYTKLPRGNYKTQQELINEYS